MVLERSRKHHRGRYKIIAAVIGGTLLVNAPGDLIGLPAHAADRFQNESQLDAGWKFLRVDLGGTAPATENQSAPAFSDAGWETVALPHTAKIEPLVANAQWQGIAWYRKHLLTDPAWKAGEGKLVTLNVEAAMQVADVWVNGQHVVTHLGGYLPFVIDLTDHLAPGGQDNVIAIRVDNRNNADVPPGKPIKNLDFNYYSGLYRNVTLRMADRLHLTDPVAADKVASGGLFVVTQSAAAEKAMLAAQAHVRNDSNEAKDVQVQFEATDARGQAVTALSARKAIAPGGDGVLSAEFPIANPRLWSPDHPNLYALKATVKTADGQAHDAITTPFGIRTIAITRENGFSINGQKMFLRGADRHQEYPFIGNALSDAAQYRDAVKIKSAGFDYVRLSHYPNDPAFLDACDQLGILVMEPIPGWQFVGNDVFKKHAVENVRDMIRRDRNHASIILWETSLNESHMDAALIRSLNAAGREEFGTLAPDQFFTAGWQQGYDVYIESRQAGNLKKYNGAKPGIISEYGDWEYYSGNAGLNQTEFKDLLKAERSSRQPRGASERLLLQQAVNFQEAANDNRSTIAFGDSVWVMFDYSRGYAKDLESSGPMDSLRLAKPSYYFFQSQRDPIVLADVKDVSSGPMAFIASYWTKDSPLNVRVYSNCEEVELFLDGQSLGKQKPDKDAMSTRLAHPPFTFKLTEFKPGTLKAIATIGGVEKAAYSVRTPEAPASLALRADTSGKPAHADGADAIFLYAHVLDKNGTTVPTNSGKVTFKILSGNARLVGDQSAPVVAGIAGLLLQAGEKPGPVVIEGTLDGVPTAQVTVDIEKP